MAPGTPGDEPGGAVPEQPPLAYRAAVRALISCAAATARLLWQGRIQRPGPGRTAFPVPASDPDPSRRDGTS